MKIIIWNFRTLVVNYFSIKFTFKNFITDIS